MEQRVQRAGKVIYLDPNHDRPTARIIRLTREAIDRRLNGERAGSDEVAETAVRINEAALRVRVGHQIRERRTRLGMSQQDLAEALDCDRSAVCRWETGHRAPTLAHLVAIGPVLDCTPADLLAEDE